MPTAEHVSAGDTTSTYRYQIGRLDWNGRRVSAIIIAGFPLQGGLERPIITNRILAEHPQLAEGVWAAFIKRPPHLPLPEWELIGSGRGRQSLAGDEALTSDVPVGVVRQLEEIFGA
jgi:hypothetical protein